MHAIRRATLRASLSASRAATPKAPSAMASLALGRIATVEAKAVPAITTRLFSQTSRMLEDEFASGSQDPLMQQPSAAQNTGDPSPWGIFVRNIVFDATEEHMVEIFGKYGNVLKCNIARDPRGLSRGFAFVFFDSEKAQLEAVEAVNGSFWHGRRIGVSLRSAAQGNQELRSRRPFNNTGAAKEPTRSLFVGNIPYETTDAELNRLFHDLENLRDVRVAVDRMTGWPRGFAHCDFADIASAEAALERLRGVTIGGRPLRVDFASEKPDDRRGPGGASGGSPSGIGSSDSFGAGI